jgi:hypothetical protein
MSTLNKPIAAIAVISSFAITPLAMAVPTLVENGSFENNSSIPWETPGWWADGTGTSGVDDRGRFCTSVTTAGANDWVVQLRQKLTRTPTLKVDHFK